MDRSPTIMYWKFTQPNLTFFRTSGPHSLAVKDSSLTSSGNFKHAPPFSRLSLSIPMELRDICCQFNFQLFGSLFHLQNPLLKEQSKTVFARIDEILYREKRIMLLFHISYKNKARRCWSSGTSGMFTNGTSGIFIGYIYQLLESTNPISLLINVTFIDRSPMIIYWNDTQPNLTVFNTSGPHSLAVRDWALIFCGNFRHAPPFSRLPLSIPMEFRDVCFQFNFQLFGSLFHLQNP